MIEFELFRFSDANVFSVAKTVKTLITIDPFVENI